MLKLIIMKNTSSKKWNFGKNHRRTLIALFTVLSMLAVYFLLSFIAGFFEFCPGYIGMLPCGGDGYPPCPPPPPCPQTPIQVITGLNLGLQIAILVTGIMLFIKERKNKANKGKKRK
jgi:hypothetical protein